MNRLILYQSLPLCVPLSLRLCVLFTLCGYILQSVFSVPSVAMFEGGSRTQ